MVTTNKEAEQFYDLADVKETNGTFIDSTNEKSRGKQP